MPILDEFDTSWQSEPAPRVNEPFVYRPSMREAWRRGIDTSVIGRASQWLADKIDPLETHDDDSFDPFDGLENTPYAEFADSFVHVRNREEFERVRRRIDREIEDREALADVSLFSLPGLANLSGNVVGDPTILLPGGVAIRGAKLGKSLAVGAGSAAVAGAGAAIISESALHQFEETRTLEESVANVGVTALFGGVLGAGGAIFGAGKNAVASRVSPASALNRAIDTYSAGSIGAAERGGHTSLSDEGLKSMFGLDKALGGMTPITRAAASPSRETRRTMQRLTEDALLRNKNAFGVPTEVSAYRRIEMWKSNLATALIGMDDQFTTYRLGKTGAGARVQTGLADITGQTSGKLTRAQFAEEVGRALIRGDKHDIPEVQKSAEIIRKTVLDPTKQAAIQEGLLDEGVTSQVAESYMMRLYDRDRISARRRAWRDVDGELQDGFEDKIVRWLEGRQRSFAEEMSVAQSSVRAALAALEKARGEAGEAGVDAANGSFGAAIEKAERKVARAESYRDEIRGLADASPDELRAIASEVTDRVLGFEELGSTYIPVAIKRGPLKQLTLTIPTKDIEGFLEMDADRVVRVYHRTITGDIELTRMFGRADMEPALQKVRDDYSRLREGLDDEAAQAKLGKREERDLKDLIAVRDMVRGTFALPDDPNGVFYRVARTTKTLNYLRLLGGMTISALSDLARPAFVHGPVRLMRDGLVPLITNAKAFRLSAREAKLAGAALDIVLDSRAMKMADVADDFGWGRTKFERGMDYASAKFGLVSLMAPWNAALKQFAGVIGQTRTLEAAAKWADGSANKREIERLASLGVDREMAGRINEQFVRHGEDQSTLKWANTEAWDDTEAAEFYRAALGKEIDKVIVTPSPGEKPIWMSTQLGSFVTQFQSFTIASMQRVLMAGLQQRDAAALSGFLGMTGLGIATYVMKTRLSYGAEEWQDQLSDDPAQWVMEGIDKSGALGYALTADHALNVLTRGNASMQALAGGEPLSRWKQREGPIGLLGPSIGGAQDAVLVAGALASGDPTPADVASLRRLIPGQNLFYFRDLFREAEEGLKEQVE